MSGVSHYQICKFTIKNNTTEVIGAVCVTLNVTSDEIMDFMTAKEDGETK